MTLGTICPWCGRKFQEKDMPLRHNLTGNRYCDRNCYELDMKFKAKENNDLRKSNAESSC